MVISALRLPSKSSHTPVCSGFSDFASLEIPHANPVLGWDFLFRSLSAAEDNDFKDINEIKEIKEKRHPE